MMRQVTNERKTWRIVLLRSDQRQTKVAERIARVFRTTKEDSEAKVLQAQKYGRTSLLTGTFEVCEFYFRSGKEIGLLVFLEPLRVGQ
jgi:hypothetical protein